MMKISLFFIAVLMANVMFAQKTFQSLNKQGNENINNNDYAKALQCFDEALKIGSDDKTQMEWTALLAATCALNQNDEKLAIKYNNIAFQNGCEDEIVINQQLELAKKLSDLKTTEQVLLKAQKIEGKYEKYTLKLLYHYYNSQQFAKTSETADAVLLFKPNHANAKYFKAVAYKSLGNEKQAIALFDEILNDDPGNAKAMLQLGLIYFNKASAEFDKANKVYKSITKPTRTDYHNYLQEIKKTQGNYKNCLPLLEGAYLEIKKQYIKDAIDLSKSRLRQLAQE